MDAENQTNHNPQQAIERRKSDHGRIASAAISQKDANRRQTLSGSISATSTENNGSNSRSVSAAEGANVSASRKTPLKSRVSLGAASSYYFKHLPKTPLQQSLVEQRKLNSSVQHQDESFTVETAAEGLAVRAVNESFGNETVDAAELSFLSMAASSSSSEGGDALNRSVLSDTTELTASNYVLATTSRYRLSELSLLSTAATSAAHKKDQQEQEVNKNTSSVTSNSREAEKEKSRRSLLEGASGGTSGSSNEAKNTRAPFSSIAGATVRRQSFPVGPAKMKEAADSRVPFSRNIANAAERRLSLPVGTAVTKGTIDPLGNTTASPSKVQNYRNTVASLKKRRLEREQQRKEDTLRRRSASSEFSSVSQAHDNLTDCSPKQPIAASSTVSVQPTNLPPLSPLMSSMSKISVSSRTSTSELDVSKRSLDELFDGLLSGAENPSGNKTAELGDLEIETQAQTNSDEASTVDASRTESCNKSVLTGSAPSELASNTTAGQSGVSPASSISTATGLGSTVAQKASSTTPGPLPESIEYINREDLLAEKTSPFRTKPGTSNAKTTPTMLKASPRRIVNPNSVDSPARNTRSAHKEKDKLVDSPARNTRSAARARESPGAADASEERTSAVPATKRKRTSDISRTLKFSTDETQDRRISNMSTVSALNSAMRKPGSNRKPGAVERRVGFGSPEMVEFNVGSPSMNLTPMPSKKLKRAPDLTEDTVEIEADMNALLQGIPPGPRAESQSALSPELLEDSTVELEEDVEQVLQRTAESAADMSLESSFSMTVPDRTVDLEVNMGALLNSAAGGETEDSRMDESMSDANEKTIAENVPNPEEDKTVELELDMGALLSGADNKDASQVFLSMNASPSTLGSRRRRSSISSRSFNLAPARRDSLLTEEDGKSYLESEPTEPMDARESAPTGSPILEAEDEISSNPAEVELTLKHRDLLELPETALVDARPTTDLLVEMSQALCDINLHDTANAIVSEVCKEVDGTMDPELDLDAIVDPSEPENANNLRKLQAKVDNGGKETVMQGMTGLVEATRASERGKWTEWLLSVAESMKAPIEDKQGELEVAIARIVEKDSVLLDTQQSLSSMASKAVRRAKRKSFTQRKVSSFRVQWISFLDSWLLSSHKSVSLRRLRLLLSKKKFPTWSRN